MRRMAGLTSAFTSALVQLGIAALIANEVRGFILAAPVLYAMYEAGGTWTALWLGFCALAGTALSVVAPVVVARKLKLLPSRS